MECESLKASYKRLCVAPILSLHQLREIRPLLDAEGANVAHARRQPRQFLERRDSAEQIGQVFGRRGLQTALHPIEPEMSECAAYVGIGLSQTLGVVLCGFSDHEIKGDSEHQRSRGSSRISARR